jgi:hypothetical protein
MCPPASRAAPPDTKKPTGPDQHPLRRHAEHASHGEDWCVWLSARTVAPGPGAAVAAIAGLAFVADLAGTSQLSPIGIMWGLLEAVCLAACDKSGSS